MHGKFERYSHVLIMGHISHDGASPKNLNFYEIFSYLVLFNHKN